MVYKNILDDTTENFVFKTSNIWKTFRDKQPTRKITFANVKVRHNLPNDVEEYVSDLSDILKFLC